MTEEQWLTCSTPGDLLEFLGRKLSIRKWGKKLSTRKWRLFVVSRHRRAWRRFRDERCRTAIETLERFADGLVSKEAFEQALEAAYEAHDRVFDAARFDDFSRRDVAQARLLRDIIGNPFRPTAVDTGWLAWNDGTVVKLAQGIYDDRAFDRLLVLADALEEAGCHDPGILAHCHQPGEHVRGCWVVDLILGKE